MLATTALVAAAAVAVAATAYAGICGVVAHRFTRALRKAPTLAAEFPELDAARVHFAARDQRARIDAWYLPAKPRAGAVVFVHGKDACRGDELKSPTFSLAQRLVAAGLSVLMIDLRGHGTSSAARLSYSEHERHDVLGAVDWLIERGYAPGSIGVLGASMGGAVALRAAALESSIGAVVADSAFADFASMTAARFTRLSGLPRCFLPGALAIGRRFAGADLARVRPLDDAAVLRGRPVLIVHGDADPFIPVVHAQALAAASGASLWITRSGRHIGSYAAAPEAYAARVIGFFARHLLGECRADAQAANDARWLRAA